MLKIKNNKVSLTRGDSLFLKVDISDENGDEYVPQEGDKLYFRLKKSASLKDLLVEKEISTENMTLELIPDDTDKLDFGHYVYEVELVKSGDLHFTVIVNESFDIREELENHG